MALLAVLLVPAVCATEVWTPQSGQAQLEDVPPDSPQGRFAHACALVASGQYGDGINMLRQLLENHPDADFAVRARYTIGLAQYGSGYYWDAFDHLKKFREDHPDSDLADDARELQMRCARETAAEDLDDGLALLEKLKSGTDDREFAARCQKIKGDLYFDARSYLFAKDEYNVLVRQFPESDWVPYCFYRMAVCELRLGEWLRRGTEHIEQARTTLDHFLQIYADHPLADKAREAYEKARLLESQWNAKFARFYLGQDKPSAAAVYMQYLIENFPHTEEGKWAAKELKRIKDAGLLPPGMEYGEVPMGKTDEESNEDNQADADGGAEDTSKGEGPGEETSGK
jgi:outer membrane assembly lipoprotein YfiO